MNWKLGESSINLKWWAEIPLWPLLVALIPMWIYMIIVIIIGYAYGHILSSIIPRARKHR